MKFYFASATTEFSLRGIAYILTAKILIYQGKLGIRGARNLPTYRHRRSPTPAVGAAYTSLQNFLFHKKPSILELRSCRTVNKLLAIFEKLDTLTRKI